MPGLTLVTPPAIEPVTLDETKAHLRLESADDDALVSALIVAARQWSERATGRAFVMQGWRLTLDAWPADGWAARSLALPRPPLITVDGIQVAYEDGSVTDWDSSQYHVDASDEPGRIVPCLNAIPPTPDRTSGGILVTYTAGYGPGAEDVPGPIRLAIKQLAAHWYEHRGDTATGAMADAVPPVVQALLAPYRIRSLAL